MNQFMKSHCKSKVTASAGAPYQSGTAKWLLCLIFFCTSTSTFAQNATSEATGAISVNQLSAVLWGESGLPYRTGPGVSLGATSFQVIDPGHIAYLCNSSNEVIVTDMQTGNVTSRFATGIAPVDFVYDADRYYILGDFSVGVYDAAGNSVNLIAFDKKYVGVVHLTRYADATFLLLPNGNSLQIEKGGRQVDARETEGTMTSTGNRVTARITGSRSYEVTILSPDGRKTQSSFITENKVAGVFVIGATPTKIYLDLQTFVSEAPLKVVREVDGISISPAGVKNIQSKLDIPNMYAVLTCKDFYLSGSGALYNMVTTPDGVIVFSLNETDASVKTATVSVYPKNITEREYHFNDHQPVTDDK